MKKLVCLCLLLAQIALPAQSFEDKYDALVSFQAGPETGLSHLFFPKLGFRTKEEGWFVGVSISVNAIAVLGVTIAPCVGYRYKGIALETSLAYTFVSSDKQVSNGFPTTGHYLNVNPKILLGHKVYAGFGPSFYLLKSKTGTLWDDLGRFNYELGYSKWLRF